MWRRHLTGNVIQKAVGMLQAGRNQSEVNHILSYIYKCKRKLICLLRFHSQTDQPILMKIGMELVKNSCLKNPD